ncbi:hypothetical protein Tco_0635148 [Tanacetum coccineum]
MAEGLSGRMLMEHRDAQGQNVFTSRAWRWLFEVRGPLVHELILDFFSMFRFGEAVLDLDTVGALQFRLGGAKRRMSWREFILGMGLHIAEEMKSARFRTYWNESARQILDKGNLSAYWRGILFEGDFLGTSLSYTAIRDSMLIYAIGRKRRAMISRIYDDLDDTWAWVASGPKRQLDAAAGALEVAEGAPDVDEGAQGVPAPVHAPQPPLVATPAVRTMPQRMARLEEEVHGIRESLAKQRDVIDAIARYFSRFTVWASSGISQLLDASRATYTRYSETHVPYQRRRVR